MRFLPETLRFAPGRFKIYGQLLGSALDLTKLVPQHEQSRQSKTHHDGFGQQVGRLGACAVVCHDVEADQARNNREQPDGQRHNPRSHTCAIP